MTITGVLLIGRPSFIFSDVVYDNEDIIGIVLALLAAITIAISMTVMRKLQNTPSAIVIFWFSMSSVILGLVSLIILDEFKMPTKFTLWLILLVTGKLIFPIFNPVN
jgi:drug/metabolite transporter (DMT)-like permease